MKVRVLLGVNNERETLDYVYDVIHDFVLTRVKVSGLLSGKQGSPGIFRY